MQLINCPRTLWLELPGLGGLLLGAWAAENLSFSKLFFCQSFCPRKVWSNWYSVFGQTANISSFRNDWHGFKCFLACPLTSLSLFLSCEDAVRMWSEPSLGYAITLTFDIQSLELWERLLCKPSNILNHLVIVLTFTLYICGLLLLELIKLISSDSLAAKLCNLLLGCLLH